MEEKIVLNHDSRGLYSTDKDVAHSEGEADQDHNVSKCCCLCIPKRYLVAIMTFLGFVNVYILRVNFSVAIVSMVSEKTGIYPNGTRYVTPPEFNWDTKLRGVLLSSFFYGYIFTQIPAGYFSSRYGGKNLLGVGILMTALTSLFTPPAARSSPYLLAALRVLEGLFEGVSYPCMQAIWSKWAPPLERSKLTMISFSGAFAGTVVGMPLSGVIADNLGWPYIFYICGSFAVIWTVFWFALIAGSPEDQRNISKEELEYILSSLADDNVNNQITSIPWKDIFMSLPVWATIVAHTAEMWGLFTLITELPTYLKRNLNFTLQEASILSSVPYVALVISVQCGGQLADLLRRKNILTTTATRKLFGGVGLMSEAVFLLVVGYTTSKTLSVVGLTLAVGLGGLGWSGFNVNCLDLAPRYAGLIFGLANTMGTIPGIVSPLIIGVLTPHETKAEWKTVFIISSCVFVFGALFFVIFASGEKQPWSDRECSSNMENEERETLISDDTGL